MIRHHSRSVMFVEYQIEFFLPYDSESPVVLFTYPEETLFTFIVQISDSFCEFIDVVICS